MRLLNIVPLLTAIALAGCNPESQPEPPKLGEVMPILPLPPEYQPVSVTGSEEALQLIFRSALDQESVARYYRQTFAEEPWRLVSDAMSPDGANVLYAEVYDSPIWVRIVRTPGAPGSTIQLSGAVVGRDANLIDSLAAASEDEEG